MEFLKNLFGSKPKVDWDEVKKSLDPKIANLKRPAVRLVKTTQTKRSKFGGLPFANMSCFEWTGSNGMGQNMQTESLWRSLLSWI